MDLTCKKIASEASGGDECVTLTDAHNYLVESTTDRDAVITNLIIQAREIVELRTARQLMPATWQGFADGFPPSHGFHRGERFRSERDIRPFDLARQPLRLGVCPVTSITSISYVDPSNTQQALSLGLCQTDLLSEPARIAPAFGQIWPPTCSATLNCVVIQFEAGYSLATDTLATQQGTVPLSARNAILYLVDKWYNTPQMAGRIDPDWEKDFGLILSPLIWDPFK